MLLSYHIFGGNGTLSAPQNAQILHEFPPEGLPSGTKSCIIPSRPLFCRCDGIGRRSGLKIHRWRHRAGSSPATGTKKKDMTNRSCLSFWVPAAGGGLHPSVFQMLGANELPLRQGFHLRQKRLYGANAPPAGWPVGASAGSRANLRISILTALCALEQRTLCSDVFHSFGRRNVIRPIPKSC